MASTWHHIAEGSLSALAACPIGARYPPEIVCKQHQLVQTAQVRPFGQRLKRAGCHCQACQLQVGRSTGGGREACAPPWVERQAGSCTEDAPEGRPPADLGMSQLPTCDSPVSIQGRRSMRWWLQGGAHTRGLTCCQQGACRPSCPVPGACTAHPTPNNWCSSCCRKL